MRYIKAFKELGKGDAAIAGGKGASLGEMTNAKIPVPGGFVITSQSFEFFLSENDLVQEIEAILKKVNHKEMESIDRASEEIKEFIMDAKMPAPMQKEIKIEFAKLQSKFVAVRSSATAEDGAEHAWAGQLDSFLNTTSKDLEVNIKRCFASLFTPRAIFYRFEKGLHKSHISVAVVVQKMVQSEKSGIAFSVHPVTEDHNQMIIEGSWGLGEAIVSGQVTPDSYVVAKDSNVLLDINISEKTRGLFKRAKGPYPADGHGANEWKNIPSKKANEQCLSGKEILKLGEIIKGIESQYGFPCDIEWAYEKNRFYIVQSRPITTLKNISSAATYFPNGVVKMGQWSLPPLASECWNSETTHTVFKKKFGVEKEAIIIHQINPLFQVPFYSADFFTKIESQIKNTYKRNPKKISTELLKFYNEVENAKKSILKMQTNGLDKLSNDKLSEMFLKNRKLVAEITVYDQFGWLSENTFTEGIHSILSSKGVVEGSERFNDLLFKLTKPKHISTTLLEKLAVYESALKFKKGMNKADVLSEKLAKDFGYMPVFSYGDPWNPTHYKAELAQVSKLSSDEINKVISELKDYSLVQQKDFKSAVKELKLNPKEAQRFIDFGLALDGRNEAEYFVSFAGLHLTHLLPEIAKRLSTTIKKLSMLFAEEIVSCLKGASNIKDILKDRKEFVAVGFTEGDMRRKVFGNDETKKIFEDFESRKSFVQGNEDSNGKCGSPGIATGKVRICKSPKEIGKVKKGDVLITYATTVDYLPAMKLASAIVTEVGGITCHAAVVSREFGIPCVIALKDAMTKFKDSDLVEVDANKGMVKIVK